MCLSGAANTTAVIYGKRWASQPGDASTSNCHHGRHAPIGDSDPVEKVRMYESSGRVLEGKLTTTIEHGVDMTFGSYQSALQLRSEEHQQVHHVTNYCAPDCPDVATGEYFRVHVDPVMILGTVCADGNKKGTPICDWQFKQAVYVSWICRVVKLMGYVDERGCLF